jgi:hypothetical protein
MTTRPGYVWDSAVSEWVEIGQSAVVAPVAYQASAPSTPATGDIWIDSDDEVPSVDSTLYYRWTKTMSGGETSLSGTDNNSLSLRYTPGYESVFINGVLQARNLDYTATSGSTIAGLTALVANDIVMVESIVAYSVGDTYTQTVSDAKYVNKNVGGLNLVIPSSVSVGSGTGVVSANGEVTFTGASTVSINGAFTSAYQNYKVIFNAYGSSAQNAFMKFRDSSGDVSTAYYGGGWYVSISGTSGTSGIRSNGTEMYFQQVWTDSNQRNMLNFELQRSPSGTQGSVMGSAWDNGNGFHYTFGYHRNGMTNLSGLTFYPASGNLTGTIRIYGYNNGA